ncbi:kinase-like domain-containing protein [Chytriomyces sp. MP71]|nr:kinase-like domain-containing protein [Chytriomyces sp. MP71]
MSFACQLPSPVPSCDSKTIADPSFGYTGPGLYTGLSSEDKARVAVMQSFANSPDYFLRRFMPRRVLGYGSNGVCIAAIDLQSPSQTPVAIKVIYKAHAGLTAKEIPAEVAILEDLSAACPNASIVQYRTHWSDTYHHYLVTELFGSNWLALCPNHHLQTGELEPIIFTTLHNGTTTLHTLPIQPGSADMWAWMYAHRIHLHRTEHHTLLPLAPVRVLLREIAHGLAQLHARGYYHGDVKVENVLVQSAHASRCGASGPFIRLADFGHAGRLGAIQEYGTRAIAVPEFLADAPFGAGDLEGRESDVFALGMIMFSLLSVDGGLPAVTGMARSRQVGYNDLLAMDAGRYPIDELSDLDADARCLLHGMLKVDPRLRWTIQDVLKSPWLSL